MTKEIKKTKKINSTNYPLGDFLIRVKNAAMGDVKKVEVFDNKYVLEVAKVLKAGGYLSEIERKDGVLNVSLAYAYKKPVVSDVKLISRPGLRIYLGAKDVEKKKGPSTYIVSTSKGVMLAKEAVKLRLGGELIAEIL